MPELAFELETRSMAYMGRDGWVEDADSFSIHRTDTGAKLSGAPVGKRYTPI
jgi:hypothetical protein